MSINPVNKDLVPNAGLSTSQASGNAYEELSLQCLKDLVQNTLKEQDRLRKEHKDASQHLIKLQKTLNQPAESTTPPLLETPHNLETLQSQIGDLESRLKQVEALIFSQNQALQTKLEKESLLEAFSKELAQCTKVREMLIIEAFRRKRIQKNLKVQELQDRRLDLRYEIQELRDKLLDLRAQHTLLQRKLEKSASHDAYNTNQEQLAKLDESCATLQGQIEQKNAQISLLDQDVEREEREGNELSEQLRNKEQASADLTACSYEAYQACQELLDLEEFSLQYQKAILEKDDSLSALAENQRAFTQLAQKRRELEAIGEDQKRIRSDIEAKTLERKELERALNEKASLFKRREKILKGRIEDLAKRERAYNKLIQKGVDLAELIRFQSTLAQGHKSPVLPRPTAPSYKAYFYKDEGNQLYVLSHLYAGEKRKGFIKQAVEWFLKSLDRTCTYAYKDLANAYLDLGEYKKALDTIQVAFSFEPTQHPPSAYFYVVRAKAYLGLNDFEKACADIEKALLNLDDQDLGKHLGALLYQKQGKIFLATANWASILANNERYLKNWDLEGFYRRSRDSFNIQALRKQTAKEELFAGNVRLENGEIKGALNHFLRAAKQNPQAEEPYHRLVTLYREENNFDALLEFGNFYFENEEYAKAGECFTLLKGKFLHLKVVSKIAYLQAKQAFDEGDFVKAKKLLSSLVSTPISYEAHLLLGKIAEQSGNLEEAEQFFRVAWRSNPTNLEGAILFAQVCLARKNYHALFREFPADNSINSPLLELIFKGSIPSPEQYVRLLELVFGIVEQAQEYTDLLLKNDPLEQPALLSGLEKFTKSLKEDLQTYLMVLAQNCTGFTPLQQLRIGKLYLRLEDFAKAESYLHPLVQDPSVSSQAYLALIEFLYQNKQWDACIQYAEMLDTKDNLKAEEKARGLLFQGLAHMQKDQPDLALRCYQSGVAQVWNDGDLNYNLALLLPEKDLKDVINCFSYSIRIHPRVEVFEAFFKRLRHSPFYKDLIPYYRKALLLAPAYPPFLKGLAELLYETEQYEELLQEEKLLRSLDPKLKLSKEIRQKKEAQAKAQEAFQTALEYQQRGDRNRLLEALSKINKNYPDYAPAYRLKGDLIAESLPFQPISSAVFTRSLTREIFSPEKLFAWAQLEKEQGDIQEACLLFGEALLRGSSLEEIALIEWSRIFPLANPEETAEIGLLFSRSISIAEQYTILGLILEKKGQWETAYLSYRLALEWEPSSKQALYLVNRIKDKRLIAEQALEAYKKAIDLKDPDASLARARFLVRIGRWKEAEGDLQTHGKKHPTHESINEISALASKELDLLQSLLSQEEEPFTVVPGQNLVELLHKKEDLYALGQEEQFSQRLIELEKELEETKKAIDLWPKKLSSFSFSSLCALAHACETLGYPEEALTVYEKALSHQPDHPLVLLRLLSLILRRGEVDARMQDYRNRLDRQGRLEGHLCIPLAELYDISDLQNLSQAVFYFKEAILFYPEASNLYRRLTRLLQKHKLSEKQIRELVGSEYLGLSLILGMHLVQKQPSKAVEYLKQARSVFPNSQLIQEHLRLAEQGAK